MDIQQSSPELMVCQALRAATDSEHEVVRKAEQQLAEWECQQGFFTTLTRICLSTVGGMDPSTTQNVDVNVRWMAVVYLKNGINKHWYKGTRLELSQEEKQQIRDLLLAHYANEPVSQISIQIAVLMARIARIDYPQEWPQLIPELLKRLQEFTPNVSGCEIFNSGEQQRVLLTLHHVIKALASRRLMAEKKMFEELTNNIYEFLYQLWDTHCQLFFHQLKESQVLAKTTLEHLILCTRILRKLSIYGYAKPQSSEICISFIEKLFERLKTCLSCRFELRQLNTDEQIIALLEKLILKQIKTLLQFHEMHGKAFKYFAPMALQFSFDHVFHISAYLIFTDNVINFGQFAIHCINLMKASMSRYYWLANSRDNENNTEEELTAPLDNFFTEERLSYICEKIITHYFVLTQIELDLWLEDPEEFSQDNNGGDTWKYALRPCVETLFVSCLVFYQTQMSEEIVKYVQKAQQIQLTENSDLKDILLKDAIYNAAGQSPQHLMNVLDFDAWFSGQLLNELKIDSDNFRILRRRIIWLLGEWACVKFSRDLRPLAYEACLHLLRPTEDMSIRLVSSQTLSTLVSDFDFAPESFLPYLETSFNAMFVLLREAKECDTKMKVLTIMSSLVEKMSDNIEPHADNLISYLPLLWKESEDYSMLRCAIICTLQQVVKAIRDIPDKMRPFLYSVIALSTDIKEPSHIYLIEEGLSLWVVVVENSTCMSEHLMNICRNIMPILEMSLENMRTVLVLIQAYILLDAHAFLEPYGRLFIDFCNRMFDDIRPEGINLMLKVLETCLKTDVQYRLELVRPVLPYIFRQVYSNKDFPMIMGMYLTMVARVLLINQQVFMEVVQELQQPDALEKILDVWITKMPLVTELQQLKLFCLAFLSIFSNNPILLERFPAIMQNINDTLFELMREDDDQPENVSDTNEINETKPIKYCDSLVFVYEYDLNTSSYCTMDDFDNKTYHYDRCMQLSLKDPVHKIVLPQYIEWQLNNLRTQLGDEAYKQLMCSIDPSVLERIGQFANLQITFPIN